MADDIASLGLEVDSTGLDKGTEKLRDFKKSADDAAKSADDFGAKATGGSEKAAASATTQAASLNKVQTAISGMSAEALGLITVLGTVAAAAAVTAGVLAYQWATAQTAVEQSLIGIGRRTGSTIADINAFSFANATATGLSVAQARAVAIEFTKTGEISVAQLRGLGDAVYGFSVLTGETAVKSAQTLAKALSGDLVKGAEELDKVYGTLDGRTIQLIATLQATGDKQQAQQIIVNALAEQNKKAADSVDSLTKAYNTLANFLSGVGNQLGKAGVGEKPQNPLDVQSAKNQSQLAATSNAGDDAVKTLLPQIDAYQKLLKLQEDLNKARNSPGGQGLGGFNDAAATAAQNQAAAIKESLDASIRYNDMIVQLKDAWGGVSAQTAITLQQLQNQLPVAEATTVATRMRAQEEATLLNLVLQKVKPEEASAIAAGQYANSKAAAVASAEKLVKSSQDNLDLLKAAGTAEEAVVKSGIAYRDAIQNGATYGQAAAIAANTLASETIRAAQAADQMAAAFDLAQKSADAAANNLKMTADGLDASSFTSGNDAGPAKQYSSGGGSILDGFNISNLTRSPTDSANLALSRGIDAAISAAQKSGNGFSSPFYGGGLTIPGASESDIISAVGSLYDLKNGQTTNQNAKASNLNAEIAWLNTLPETIVRDQNIINLQKSIDQLNQSTGSLNTTMQDALSPYYSQDPRTSHIGFRSQGMASGGEFTVPGGYSANDNVMVQMPLASGEIVSVRRPGDSSGGNSGTVIQISMPITIQGSANKDDVGRTMYQAGQNIARQLAASSR